MKYLVLLPVILLCSCGHDTRPTPEQLGSHADTEIKHIRDHIVPSESGAILIVYHKPSNPADKPWAEWRWLGDRTDTENLMQAILAKLRGEDPPAPVTAVPPKAAPVIQAPKPEYKLETVPITNGIVPVTDHSTSTDVITAPNSVLKDGQIVPAPAVEPKKDDKP